MKKVQISDFLIQNDILTTNETGVFYDCPKSEIEKTWELLVDFYLEKQKKEDKDELNTLEFSNLVLAARNEHESATVTFDLCDKSILKEINITEIQNDYANIKLNIVESTKASLNYFKSQLNSAIEEERRVYKEIRDIPNETTIEDLQLKVNVGSLKYVNFDIEENIEHEGLICKIQYKENTYQGFYKFDFKSKFQYLQDLNNAKLFIGVYKYPNMCVELGFSQNMEYDNPVCKAVIDQLISGNNMEDIVSKIRIYISRFMVSNILRKYKERRLVMDRKYDIQCDSLTEVFYVITESGVINVDRRDGDIRIYINGNMVSCDDV